MNQHLQSILNFIEQDKSLSADEKNAILKSLKDADKELEITEFKLDRTEKVKKTTAILLEETIEELEQKRKAVEAQNRELETETVLEKVRAVAMGMRQPEDMLDVCRIISQQLDLLNVKEIRNVQTAIFNQQKGIYLNYEFFRLHNKTTVTEVEYNLQPDVKDFVNQMLTDPEAFFTTAFEGAKLKQWMEYQEKANQFVDPHLHEVNSLHYYFYSIGPGALGISTYIPLHDKDLAIFKRFRNVFELAYRRFIDIEQALAQAREAQIEAALEKVRSRSLAMHRSDDLQEVVNTVFDRLTELDIEMDSANIAIFKEGTRDYDYWVASHFQKRVASFHMPYTELLLTRELIAARESGTDFSAKAYSFEEKNEWFNYAFKDTDFKFLSEERRQFILDAPAVIISIAFSKYTGLQVTRYSTKLLSEREVEILKRFSKVFEQAYTRFLDLQKAEAQSRENQIQLALERARTQSMIMQHSTELDDTLRVFHEQVLLLGIPSAFSFLWLPDENRDRHIFWAAWAENNATVFKSKAINYPLDRNEPATAQCLIDWKSNQPVVSYHVPPNGVENYFAAWSELIAGVEQLKPGYFSDGLYYVEAFMKYGCFGVMVKSELPEDEKKIFARFAIEFERTYTRFLDLQKAEAQAKEAKIEAALEKVRSRTMAMQRSEELAEVATVLFQQVKTLGVPQWTCGFSIFEIDDKECTWYPGSADGDILPPAKIPLTEHPVFISYNESRKRGDELYIYEKTGEVQADHYRYMRSLPGGEEMYQNTLKAGLIFPAFQIDHIANFSHGNLVFITYEHFPEMHDVFKRFAKVFEQTYTRFLDLQKAEAQAREAQIEASLERVRSRTMAMHNSQDVGDTVATLFDEFVKLGIETFRCGIGIIHQEKKMEVWTAKRDPKGKVNFFTGYMDMTMHPLLQGAYSDWKKKQEFYIYELKGDDLKEYFSRSNNNPNYPLKYDIPSLPSRLIFSVFYFPEGFLFAFTMEKLSAEATKIFKRFSGVFGQTYRRYLDLQKAEAQAREAQIEAALEKVRSRTMAMQRSEELSNVATVLFQQVKSLGVPQWTCGFCIWDIGDTECMWYPGSPGPDGEMLAPSRFPLTEHPVFRIMDESRKRGDELYIYEKEGEVQADHYRYMMTLPGVRESLQDMLDAGLTIPTFQIDHYANFAYGNLIFITYEHFPEMHDIFKRFAKVFEQTYTRFLDLQRAEAQTRQAQIETAIEKVRARALAMQKPEELVEVAQVLRKEMGLLGVEELETSSIYIHDEISGTTECWYAIQDIRGPDKKLVTDHMTINLNDTWVGMEMLKFYNSDQKQISIVMQGENRKEWINYCAQHSKVLQGYYGDTIQERTYHLLKFSNGYMGATSPGDISAESWELLRRATSVFSLAYTRFCDLQIAEASAKEAVKQSALDRIRADIASMRTVSDLDRITPLIWNELTILGVPFIRCGVFIMDDSNKLIHTFLSTPEGKAIAAFHLPYDTPGNVGKILSHWQDKKSYTDHWDESSFIEFAEILVKQGSPASREHYLETIPHGGFYLHLLPFLQGMLYVGNTTRLSEEEIKLIQSVADAFSTAYARYEDFNKLEAAKQQVDKTLVELKQAQTQLVQSEKMASLGELTAGIAHEIQNPLNFVNNFSEVSNELLDEMITELENNNKADAIAIADDVKQNLEKILHHGKRADGIVKGMLQHSRSSSAVKEPTDINKLADEYLRLAYHGLRAKDKTFNAKFETDFDKSVGQINIIPQDIGRVLVNLINNAFYAVTEKRKKNIEGYEPTVTITTKKIADKVELKVIDNGNGVPQKVLDKIFQPFFTTKPTGQGTGLGLSLSYDIIKAHGGEIKVETTEGEGSEFVIKLPFLKYPG